MIYILIGVVCFLSLSVFWMLKNKALFSLGCEALEQYKETKEEKYAVMLCALASVYRGGMREAFWEYFEESFYSQKITEKDELEFRMSQAGDTLKDSIDQKNILAMVDKELYRIVCKCDLKGFRKYIEVKS